MPVNLNMLNIDLHSHSGYSGGVGQVSLESIVYGMKLKGIDIFGTGDCLHRKWQKLLSNELSQIAEGIFISKFSDKHYFILQTEVIFTIPYAKGKRKLFHIVMTFPDFLSVKKTADYIESIGVSNNIGRPFIKFYSLKDVNIFMEAIKSINENIEFIPAHVMTPQGIFGSINPLYSLNDMFGEAKKLISIVETGLSSDPQMLSLIPELDNINFISNSDCHSPGLNRIGREYTQVKCDLLDYNNIMKCLKDKEKTFTYEFPPQEGKFFLTGHRKGKVGHEHSECVFSPDFTPESKICPVCKKKLTIGVYEQLLDIVKVHKAEDRLILNPYERKNYKWLVPLTDVILFAKGNKTFSKKISEKAYEIINFYGSERALWKNFNVENHRKENERLLWSIEQVKNGNFSFFPGYDGEYGKLVVGKELNFLDINIC
ncbi:MAG: endonuclease Q family protein [Candidatus Muirbacterium halophilum]|nr:endonuclease Q family protein [Candidatus Muirbacterium halophilum]MCK9476200.1 endonuclease Q family protein [Candidatus Muirbacterium halophilum]